MLIATFLLALFFAWPTFGVSLAIWLVFALMSAKSAASAENSLDERIEQFKGQYFADESQANFMRVLAGEDENYGLTVLNDKELGTLSNILIRYIATHPDIATTFQAIVSRYATLPQWGPSIPEGGRAARAMVLERDLAVTGGALHHLCFQAIQTLRINNPDHSIIGKLDLGELEGEISLLEMSMDHEREMGRSIA